MIGLVGWRLQVYLNVRGHRSIDGGGPPFHRTFLRRMAGRVIDIGIFLPFGLSLAYVPIDGRLAFALFLTRIA